MPTAKACASMVPCAHRGNGRGRVAFTRRHQGRSAAPGLAPEASLCLHSRSGRNSCGRRVLQVNLGPAPGKGRRGKALWVDEMSENFEAVDDAWARPAEIRRAVGGEHSAVAKCGKLACVLHPEKERGCCQ